MQAVLPDLFAIIVGTRCNMHLVSLPEAPSSVFSHTSGAGKASVMLFKKLIIQLIDFFFICRLVLQATVQFDFKMKGYACD